MICVAGFLYVSMNTHITTLAPAKSDALLVNPMTGYAPKADYLELAQDEALKATLVYVDVTWRQFEPQKGVYDFQTFEEKNHLDFWRTSGKRIVFRFVCDFPEEEEHMDIPDWLYEETNHDGDWYDCDYGKGYSPNYENAYFIERHRLAIEALGERYGKDDFFCFIELGSLGHWGEWHVNYDQGIRRLPDAIVREQYITPYLISFPNAMLLMRRPFASAKEFHLGLYNDMTGMAEDTREWLDWIQNGGDYDQTNEPNALVAMPNGWQTAPIGGEFTSALTMKELLDSHLSETKEMIEQSHMSFIGPKVPSAEELQYTQGIDQIRALLGYRLRVEKALLMQSPLYKDVKIKLQWVNDGIAPFYKDWSVMLYLFDENGKQVYQQQLDIALSSVVDHHAVEYETFLDVKDLEKGVYEVCIAAIDPTTGKPGIAFAMENSRNDLIYSLGMWEKK